MQRAKRNNIILFSLLAIWLIVAAYGIRHYAYMETEPPVFDALSYVQKAQSFWDAMSKGEPFNPLNLAPEVRPFGTVFFTFPFGFSTNFHEFYFLTNFLPALLLVIAVLIAAGSIRDLDNKQKIALTMLLVCIASMPAYFQFAASGDSRFMGTWGFVDILFGAVSAIACACVVASFRGRYLLWSLLAALCAILAILIKPVGLATMAIVGATWGALTFSEWRKGSLKVRTAFWAGLMLILLFGATGLMLYHSQYFSHKNIEYGESSMRLLHAAEPDVPSIFDILEKMRISVGIPVLIIWIVCLACAARFRHWMSIACSLAIFSIGCYVWLGRTNLNHVRYFFPFPLMAAVVVVPVLLRSARAWSYRKLALFSALMLPSFAIGVFLLIPHPSQKVQFILGVNLAANRNADVVKQAKALVGELEHQPNRLSIIYYVGGSDKVNAFEAVMDWHRILGFPGGNSIPALPVDWVRSPAYRLDEMFRARYIVFEPIADPQNVLDTQRSVKTFDAEQVLVRAWLTTLGPKNGVVVHSDDGVRVLEVVNRFVLNQAGVGLMRGRRLRGAFLQGFHPITGVPVRDAAQLSGNLLAKPIDLTFGGHTVARALAVTRTVDAEDTIYHIVIEQIRSLAPVENGAWQVFLHVLDKDGHIVAQGYQTYLSDAASSSVAMKYDIGVPSRVSVVSVSIGFGVFKPLKKGSAQDFISGTGDWGGRRNIIELPTNIAK